ncbi:xanthine dehydrogenase family protein molybdopterin-binding subunit [Myxococcus landrumensis]|uniref:Xanthine dehydrogenase family protein molybdopterin-binding subunit n=1 Tax=Myxococcus landrumensis TaxID=2813577 RepID=A0ABX7NAK2_9BACT|nr:molybdopterin cofactor-binding domain-containing protein [Myxococcus landrumus]QSQ14554.1 xanthine dehydrogenase family protein molybdopterin-binding subunit [Myxococcus landrumus]
MSQQPVVLTRRSFLEGLNLSVGGLALGLVPSVTLGAAEAGPRAKAAELKPSVFVHVAADGLVTIVCHRSEMGQGIRSSMPVVIADELGADMARVKVVQADGDAVYGDQNTDGSSSIRNGVYEALRRTGATARTMLVAAAAKRWKVKPADCEARDHAVFHRGGKRSLAFGELVADAVKLPVPKPEAVQLRPRSELRRVGRELPLLDGPSYVNGTAVFGADVRLPGMLIAVVARPPVVGGKVVRFDATKALAIPGVKKVLELPEPQRPYLFQGWGGVAVLAENTWAAMRGRAALDIAWENGPNESYDSAQYRQALLESVRIPGTPARSVGDVDQALAKASRVVEAEYYTPHLSHAPMEPPVALARVDGGTCEVWAPTQHPQAARTEAARVAELPEDKVAVHVTLLGGGFGRKSKADFVAEAVFLAKAAGVPVRVQWTREDDLRHDYYHSASAQRLSAGLDASGKPTAWLHRTSFPAIRSTFSNDVTGPGARDLNQGVLDLPLAIPNVRAEMGLALAKVRIGWLRSVNNIFHAFALGSFMDELAHARGLDPRDNLLEVIGPARHASLAELGVAALPNYGATLEEYPVDAGRLRRVIERVTELSGWSEREKNGRTLGLAAHRSFLTYVGVVVSVKKDEAGKARVDEAWVVVDAGLVVNPDRVRSQMEGSVIFGMSLALYGSITMKGGATQQSNFRDFRLVRVAEAPRAIHVDIIQSESPSGGVGEPGVPPVAPAIANALFALTGTRVRDLPIVQSLAV